MMTDFVRKSSSHNADGWLVNAPGIEYFVTEEGGQIAPVVFRLPDGKTVEPYHLTPWQDEDKSTPPTVTAPEENGRLFRRRRPGTPLR